MERRLAAILLTDMVGYSQLMGLDEEGTIARQQVHRHEVFDPKISQHSGRIVKSTGDGLLVEFQSVIDAVRCAIELQTELNERDTDLPMDRRIQYRIGINLGDIVIDGEDILGDGVNVAARLEGLSKPGGICISGSVHDQLVGKIDIVFEDAGQQTVKNVPRPIKTWLWPPDKLAAVPVAIQNSTGRIDRPSIAVLPFKNLSSDSEQEFIADGMAEDIISGLSKFRWLLVVAGRSTFTYKGQNKSIPEIASELGSRYIVEGSVRSARNRIRVTAQLIDAETGNQIWSERYDRGLEDIFAVQDEVSDAIVREISPELSQSEIDRARRTPPDNLDAWGFYQRGLAIEMSGERDDFEVSISLFDRARQVSPSFVDALAMAALQRVRLVYFFRPDNSHDLIRQAKDLIQSAMRLDPRHALTHFAQGRFYSLMGDGELAVAKCEEGIELDSNSVLGFLQLAPVYSEVGRWEDSLKSYEKVLRLSPKDPRSSSVYVGRSYNLFYMGRYDESVEAARKALAGQNPRYWAAVMLVGSLSKLDRKPELQAAKDDLFRRRPDLTISTVSTIPALAHKEFLDVLRKAGIPE